MNFGLFNFVKIQTLIPTEESLFQTKLLFSFTLSYLEEKFPDISYIEKCEVQLKHLGNTLQLVLCHSLTTKHLLILTFSDICLILIYLIIFVFFKSVQKCKF